MNSIKILMLLFLVLLLLFSMGFADQIFNYCSTDEREEPTVYSKQIL